MGLRGVRFRSESLAPGVWGVGRVCILRPVESLLWLHKPASLIHPSSLLDLFLLLPHLLQEFEEVIIRGTVARNVGAHAWITMPLLSAASQKTLRHAR